MKRRGGGTRGSLPAVKAEGKWEPMWVRQSLGDARFSALTGHLGQSHSLHLLRLHEVVSETGQGAQEERASLRPFQTSF